MSLRASAALVERDHELARLRDTVADVEAALGTMVVIEGEAGIGKSRLVSATCALARQNGFLVLTAGGGVDESDFSYGVVR
ncbi:MAG: AAA family ATPase, partial [Gammaproteobacteria bacterium]